MQLATFSAGWQRIPRGIRSFAIAAMTLAAIATIVFTAIAQRPRGALFATPLHAEQLAEVEERLAAWNVAFTPTDDNAIVDASRRGDLLLRLSLAGVPHAHVASSTEALSGIGALTPQAVIDAQARAGLAGDIELGLRGIAGVEDARVIVAPAHVAEFADDTSRDASASVRLRLREGATIASDAVDGIRQFVAASVAGLDASHVTIVDDRGVPLGRTATADDVQQRQFALQSALDEAFGGGATIVRIRELHDPRQQTTHDVQRIPLGAIDVHRTDERYGDGGKRYERHDRNEERGTHTRETTTNEPAGRLTRTSVAVLVDQQRAIDLVKIREVALATVGIDERRGDTLTVESVDFAHDRAPRKDGWWLAYGAIVPLLPTLAVVIGVLIALRNAGPVVGRTLRATIERATLAQTREAVRGFAPASVAQALRNEPPHAAAAIISALPAATAAAVLDLYPPGERTAIVQRMQRARSPLMPEPHEVIDRA